MLDRNAAGALMPQPLATEIIKELPRYSAIRQLARPVNMGTKTMRLPVLSALPSAGFVDGDTGHAPTSQAEWKNEVLVAETVKAAIVVPKAVLDDSAFNIMDEIKPLLAESIGIALDQAGLFGIGKPASFPCVVAEAIAAGNVITHGTNPQNKGGLYKDLIDTMFKSVVQGYRVTGWAGAEAFEQYLLSSFDANGRPLADLNAQQKMILGRQLAYTATNIWPIGTGVTQLISGDWTKLVLGMRQDMNYTVVTEGVVSDPVTGAVIYNLPQQGMIEIIVEARFGLALAKPVTREQSDETKRCPFSVLLTAAA